MTPPTPRTIGRAKVPGPAATPDGSSPVVARASVPVPGSAANDANSTLISSPPPPPPPAGKDSEARSEPDPPRHSGESTLRKTVRIAGEVFITFGLIVLLFAFYEVYGSYYKTKGEQNKLEKTLEQQWEEQRENPAVEPPQEEELEIGDGIAKLYIPRMGGKWVVVEGEDPADIKYAPGHFRGTAFPGESGNFSVAGHRSPAIFMELDSVKQGDSIIVETAQTWYVYRVYETLIVNPTDTYVTHPDADNPDRKLLTLVTCNPRFDNTHRLIVHGELVREQPASDGKPEEL